MQHFYTSNSLVQKKQGKELLSRFISAKFFLIFFALVLFLGVSLEVDAQVTVTPATGGTGLSVDKAANSTTPVGGTFTSLSTIILQEPQAAYFTPSTFTSLVISAPSNWTFNPGVGTVTVIPTNGQSGDFYVTNLSITASTITVSFAYNLQGNNNGVNKIDGINIAGLQVKATDGAIVPSTGNITSSITGTTSLGTLSQGVGTVTKLGFTTQPATSTYGTAISGVPVIQTQDQYGNPSIIGLASSLNVTLTFSSGNGTLTNNVVNIGTAGGNGTATFSNLLSSAAGTKVLSAAATNYTSAVSSSFVINPKVLTITGATAVNKVYDGGTTGTLSGTPTLVGVINSDVVALSAVGATGIFANKNVGTGKTVTATGYTISGTGASNYTLTQPTLTANITTKALTISGVSGVSRMYDGTTSAMLSGVATLVGIITPDAVTLGGASITASFVNKNIGTGKAITVSGYTISGTDAGNYTLTQPTGLSANITAKELTISGLAGITKVYDGTTSATLPAASLVGVISPDAVTLSAAGATAAYSDKNVGTGKTITVAGYTITGAGIGNYTLTQPTGITGAITGKSLTISGLTGVNKIYDGTTTGSLSGTPTLVGIVGSDVVTVVASSASTAFADKNIGTSKPLTVTGYSLGSTDAGNYTLTQPTGQTANITQRPLTITGILAASKEYDGLTSCELSGATLLNTVTNDDVTLVVSEVTAAFNNANVGTGKSVSLSGLYSITGTAANNYSISQPVTSLTANITRKTLTISGVSGVSRTYDATTTCALTGTAVLEGLIGTDVGKISLAGTTTATAAFLDKNVGIGKIATVSGYTLSGAAADLDNYTLELFSPKADVTPRNLAVTVLSENKTTSNGDPIVSLFSTDKQGNDVIIYSYATAKYVIDQTSGAKTIDVTGIAISGTDAGNYALQTTQAMGLDPLPVTLVSFTGKSTAVGVTLNWSTATEKDNAYFQVERSLDGKTFVGVGKVKGNGNSSTLIKYQFVDGQSLSGTVYYRLRQVDVDGKFELSKVIAVNAQGGSLAVGIVKAYPNPTFTGKVSLEAGRGQGGTAVITLLNGNGQIISKQETVLVEGQPLELDLTQQKAGMYYLQVENGAGRSTCRIAKQ
ncbi:YDG domain-containing protein [Rufibacter sp. DG15C]|uniref:YDG domain-containing protein n=1 Tax=Rufibacter sp. DG15C TaxID=1379909 RepID=UPI000835D674|nr:YDG domain-containing protein [Rufibacter sp. DG15C]